MAFFFCVCAIFTFFLLAPCIFVTSVKICAKMIEVSSEQSRKSVLYAYIVLLPLLLLCVAMLLLLQQYQCCCFLLLFVIVCRMDKFVAGVLNLISVFSFSSFKRD